MKNRLKKQCSTLAAGILFLLGMTSAATADTIVKLPLDETGFDVEFDGTTFSTFDDGDATTTGDQNTRVLFEGFLGLLPDIDTPVASFSLNGVLASGSPSITGPVIVQTTTGGTFDLYDGSNVLLLSGSLSDGAITGSSTDTTGSFFTTTFSIFTGGTLAALLDPNSAGLSFAMTSIVSEGGLPGLQVVNGALLPFVGDSSGLIEGSRNANAIPEPMSAALLLTGLVGAAAKKRRRAE